MSRRVLFALAAPAVVVPFEAVQLVLMVRAQHPLAAWPALLVANLLLLTATCALAADFPLAGRNGRAVLVGMAIPLLLPGPTVADIAARMLASGSDPAPLLPFIFLNVVLLLMLGCAEAGIYLLATRPTISTD